MQLSIWGGRESKNQKLSLSLVLTFVFFILVLVGILRHEMWRDEMQAWLIARDSSSIANLMSNLSNELHPPLWHMMLYGITRFTSNPVWMQMLHLCLATLGVFLFVQYSPFSWWVRGLFIFGYYPFFEYAVKSRCYVLGLILTWLFCIIYTKKTRNYYLLVTTLFLLSTTSLMGAVMALSLLFIMLSANSPPRSWSWQTRLVCYSIVVAAVTGVIYSYVITPGSIRWFLSGLTHFSVQRMQNVLTQIGSAYFPGIGYFAFVSGVFWKILRYFLSVLALIIPCVILWRSRGVFKAYSFGLLLLSVFIYSRGLSLWHLGYLFILFLACLWILGARSKIKIKYAAPFLIVVLFVQAMYGIKVMVADWAHPFSESKAAAQFIRANGWEKMPMIGDIDYRVSPITGYLNNQIYYPRGSRLGSFIIWDGKRWRPISSEALMQIAQKLAEEKKQDILVILSYPLKSEKIPPNWKIIRDFTHASRRSYGENYYLYYYSYLPESDNKNQ